MYKSKPVKLFAELLNVLSKPNIESVTGYKTIKDKIAVTTKPL